MTENKALTPAQKNDVAAGKQLPVITPAVDIYENENEILMHADMPGVQKEDITISIDDGKLHLSGSRSMVAHGASRWQEFGEAEYSRTFSVPQTIDVATVTAHLEQGVLHLRLPKLESAKPKQIKITTN